MSSWRAEKVQYWTMHLVKYDSDAVALDLGSSSRLHAHVLLGAEDLGMARLAQLVTVFPAVQGSGMKCGLVGRFHIVCLTSVAGDC
jgi:hypothetical protein